MSQMTQWNPFAGTRLNPANSLDELFRALVARPTWRASEVMPDIRVDVTENDTGFTVKAEIPGVERNDIEISADGNQLSIGAEVRRKSSKENDARALCTERFYGKAQRSFTLPSEIDAATASAHYEHGVLTLVLPKKKNGSSRRIAVN